MIDEQMTDLHHHGSPTVLKTKFHIPFGQRNILPRHRLWKKLDAGLSCRVSILSAPPGFGKTTLMSDWIQTTTLKERNARVAWLSLEKADNDIERFWLYFRAAVEKILPDVSIPAKTLHNNPRAEWDVESMVNGLINAIADISCDIVVVLDDYHFIRSTEVNRSVEYLIDHMPSHMHLYLTTRVDPDLPTHRWMVRGELVRLGHHDLRFTTYESQDFMNEMMGLHLSDEQFLNLETWTEGWVAGLQITAISMQETSNHGPIMNGLVHGHRAIFEFLLEEVLQRQTPEVQQFLLQTSILEQFTHSLCDAVTGEANSQVLLEQLEKSNMFVVPLDAERTWFRYHHLFAEALKAKLTRESVDVKVLYDRAARWCQRQGMFEGAVHYALAAENHELAGIVVLECAEGMWQRGDSITLKRWLEALPSTVIQVDPELCVFLARAFLINGWNSKAQELLYTAESLMSSRKDPRSRSVLGAIKSMQANVERIFKNWTLSSQLSERALQLLDAKDEEWAGWVSFNLGDISHWFGRTQEALRHYHEAVCLWKNAGNSQGYLRVIEWSTELLCDTGRVAEAMSLYEDGMDYLHSRGESTTSVAGIVHIGMGQIFYETNQLHAAYEHFNQGLKICESGGLMDYCWKAHFFLARVKQAQGDPNSARYHLRSMEQIAPPGRVPWTHDYLLFSQVRLFLADGNVQRAVDKIPELLELISTADTASIASVRALATIYLAQEKFEDILHLLRVHPFDVDSLQNTCLEALALAGCHKNDHALQFLKRALTIADPSGNVRSFLDHGEPMKHLLQLGARTFSGDIRDRALQLLLSFGGGPMGFDAESLIEPLSEREQEVLSLVAEGASNNTIAQTLFISINTSKKHIANIMAKLGASNRTQAVSRARELGLIR